MTRPPTWWDPLSWPLTSGTIPRLLLVVGVGALVALAVSREGRWRTRRLPAAAVLAVALTALLYVVVMDWWQPFPDRLPRRITAWVGLGILGLCLAGFRMPALRLRGRALAALGGCAVLLMSASLINRHFEQYPTLRVMAVSLLREAPKLDTRRATRTIAAAPSGTLAEQWHKPAGLPVGGTLATVRIPGATSGYHPRDGYVYLPPAYQADPRPLLPVVVLMAGQPSGPDDWAASGGLKDLMDDFAAAHDGLSPIVLVPDVTGSPFGNTLCMDSNIAKVQTYLAKDVPEWTRTHLQTATGRQSTAIAGVSYGGTCALQLAVNAPEVYGSLLDISGQEEPTLGTHEKTVEEAFGGDEAAFAAVNPLQVMARQKFPNTAATFVVGRSDPDYVPQQQKVYEAAVAAGMKARAGFLDAGHNWTTARLGLSQNLTWLSQQTRLLP